MTARPRPLAVTRRQVLGSAGVLLLAAGCGRDPDAAAKGGSAGFPGPSSTPWAPRRSRPCRGGSWR